MKADYTPLTPHEAREWLIENDREGAELWLTIDDAECIEAVLENIKSFGTDGIARDFLIKLELTK